MIVHGCEFPEDRHYHVEFNVWLRRETNGMVTLGITAFGCALAGEFLSFMPKQIGAEFDAGRAVGMVEFFKTVGSVRTPISCTLIASNAKVLADPALLARDPYGEGWLVRLKPKNWDGEAGSLVSGAAIAAAFEEAMRLEDFEGNAAP